MIKYQNYQFFFYHIPKCAGTTTAVLISHLLKNSYRIKGTLFSNNDKGGITAYDNYIKNEKLINASNINFLYGHTPFEIHEKIIKKIIFPFLLSLGSQ